MSTAPPTGLPDVTSSAGPLLLGYLFNWGLFGVLSVQVYMYFRAFPKDKTSRKLFVCIVYAVEVLQTALIAHDAFVTYAAGFGNLEDLIHVHLLWLAVPVLSGVVSATVQIYYAIQISILWKRKFVPCTIALIALIQGSGAVGAGVQAHNLNNFALLQSGTFTTTLFWLIGSAVCDVMIAVSMTFALTRYDTSFRKTHDLVNKLIRLTVETGALTATIAVVDLILFLAVPNTDYHITPALILAKLYSNSLLVVLNSRIKITYGGNDTYVSGASWNTGSSEGRHKMAFANQPRAVDHRLESIELGGLSTSDGTTDGTMTKASISEV